MSKTNGTTHSFIELLESFTEDYLPNMRGYSDETLRSYKTTYSLFIEFLYLSKGISADEITFSFLEANVVQDFLMYLEGERSNKVSTRNQRRAALSSFAEYAQNRDVNAATIFKLGLDRTPVKKYKAELPIIMNHEEVQFLLSIPDVKYRIGYRDLILLSTMYATAARSCEMADLKRGDIHFDENNATITLDGKGKKKRVVKISSKPASMLKEYLRRRRQLNSYDAYVFFSQNGDHLEVSGIEEVYEKYVIKARKSRPDLFREKSYTPHTMRHTSASHMLEAGVPIEVIKNILGHASIATTEIYAQLTQATVDDYVREWNRKWFPTDLSEATEHTENAFSAKTYIPDFLRKR